MKVIFDLDGTLLNSKLRLYRLFQHLCPESQLTYEDYWVAKEKGISNLKILSDKFLYTPKALMDFNSKWMSLIESDFFLSYDILFDDVNNALSAICKSHSVYLCTARQSKDTTISQLKRLGIFYFFEKIMVTQQRATKVELVSQHGIAVSDHDWFIGDTGEDIKSGKKLKMKTCAVTYGFLSRKTLCQYKPDLFIDSLDSFAKKIKEC